MEIIFILLLILLNGFLSMAEIALVSVRKTRLEGRSRKGDKGASEALRISGNMDHFLSAVQIGITLVGILTGLFSGQQLTPHLAVWIEKLGLSPHDAFASSQVLIIIIITYFTLILGELVPKRLGLNFSEQIACFVSRPMHLLAIICRPFVWLLAKSTSFFLEMMGLSSSDRQDVTEEEIRAILHEGAESGVVQEVEEDIVERVFTLGDRNVGSIMTHRRDLVWLDINDTNELIREKVIDNLFNVYPVADKNLDQLLGVIYLKDLFVLFSHGDFSLGEHLREIQYFPEKLNVYSALEQLKQEHVKYGIVTDEFGTIRGIVTMKDIVKALIGTIREQGEEPEIVDRKEGGWLVDGQCSFYDFLKHVDREELYDQHPYNTISGLILKLLEHIPSVGEVVEWEEFRFEIVDLDGVRIDKIWVRKKADPIDPLSN